jgi:hypothetical protein
MPMNLGTTQIIFSYSGESRISRMHQSMAFLTPFGVHQRLKRLPPCLRVPLSDAVMVLHAAAVAAQQPDTSFKHCKNLRVCSSAVIQHV